jgi:hypothetical protein
VKKIITISILSILAMALTACGASAGSSQINTSGGSSASNPGSSNSSTPEPINVTPTAGPSALQLAAGIIKLDGTSNAVNAQQAAQLLPLWQSLQQIETTSATQQAGSQGTPQVTPGVRPNSAMMQQVQAQFVLIQNAMTPAQIQAITAMNLNRQDISSLFFNRQGSRWADQAWVVVLDPTEAHLLLLKGRLPPQAPREQTRGLAASDRAATSAADARVLAASYRRAL